MKIAIDIGHNCPCDRGASGIHLEDTLTKELGTKLIDLLLKAGHQPVMVTPSVAVNVGHSLKQRVDKANKNNCDLYVSLHFNAFYGRAFGTEVYARSSQGMAIAQRVQTEICKLGFHDRKVKQGSFYVLRKTKMPAILVECCFCDSPRDMSLYEVNNMASAIKNGILGIDGVYVPVPKTRKLVVRHDTWVKGSVEESALLDEIKQNIKIPEESKRFLPRGIYTIIDIDPIEEAHYYVKLKSGLEGYVYHGHADITHN